MLLGTGSGVGKSILTAGFCRIISDMGISVAPFKAQNMALNSGVTLDGLEMGRAQILQAEAAKVTAEPRMNPILLKPQGNSSSQLVRMGLSVGVYSAREYYELAEENFEIVKEAYDSLCSDFDCIVIEGAGSPAEINLLKTDIVNMRMAEYAQAKSLIVGDIDRGGVFAWMKGTYDLIEEDKKKYIDGFIINRFRGDISLLQPGIKMFEDICDVPIRGTVPWFDHGLEDEDSQNIKGFEDVETKIIVGVIRLPHISNFSDFNPLKFVKGLKLKYLNEVRDADECDLIIIPGSKNTIKDMKFLNKRGFSDYLKSIEGRKPIIGICGGFQMMGRKISDPKGYEGECTEIEGLGLISAFTEICEHKELKNKQYTGKGILGGIEFSGYEIHMGRTVYSDSDFEFSDKSGVCVYDSCTDVFGTYIHGLFESPEVTKIILGLTGINVKADYNYYEEKNRQIDMLADIIRENVDVRSIFSGLF